MGKGIWSRQHNRVTFDVPNHSAVDLECGDWIQFDATSMDAHQLLNGATWADKSFIITKFRHNLSGSSFEAINFEDEMNMFTLRTVPNFPNPFN